MRPRSKSWRRHCLARQRTSLARRQLPAAAADDDDDAAVNNEYSVEVEIAVSNYST